MRVLVCGSRYWDNMKAIRKQLKKLPKGTTIIHGAALGADFLAGEVAKELGFKVKEFPADWDRYDIRAGPIRNKQMLEEGKPDRILAFTLDLTTSSGTKHMVMLGYENEIPTEVFNK